MRVAIVTGASSGLGRAFARRLDRMASLDEIWLIARRENRLEELRKQLSTPVRVLPWDITKKEKIEELERLLKKELPDVRFLVNCAGMGKFGTVLDMTMSESDRIIELNCRALVDMTIATVPYMWEGARILNVASTAAFQPLPGFNIYAASKAFVLSYSRALRAELRDWGVVVTAVCPSWLKTEFIPVAQNTKNGGTVTHYPFAMSPDDMAARALRDSQLGLAVSTCLPGKLQRIATKLAPTALSMFVWQRTRN